MIGQFRAAVLAAMIFAGPPLFAAVEVPAPSAVRAVQCGAFQSEAEAGPLVASLEASGYGPVWLHQSNGKTLVLVGRCERFPDALILKRSLRANGHPDAYERAFKDLVSGDFSTEMQMPDDPILLCPADVPVPQLPAQLELAPEMQGLEQALRGTPDEAAIEAAEALVESLGNDDPVKGWAAVRLGHAVVRKEKKAKPVVPLFLDVACGRIAAPAAQQMEARWMAADSIHYYLVDPLTAYRAYSEILAEHGEEDPGIVARAMVEKAACLLELAQRQQAYYNEVRRAALQCLRDIPAEFKRARAVADLLHCEAHLYEGEHEQALAAFRDFDQRNPECPRERAMACEMRGWLHLQASRFEDAKAEYSKNLEVDLSAPAESFYWQGERWDFRERALRSLVLVAEREGNISDIKHGKQLLEDRLAILASEQEAAGVDTAFPGVLYSEEN